MHCVVTGAAGFVGSSLCERLLRDGHTVKGIDCFIDYYPRENKEFNLRELREDERFEFVEQDLVDACIVSLLEGADWVFHQAAQAGVRASWGGYFGSYTRNNLTATQRLLEGVKTSTIKKLVYASSSSIYGNAESFPTSEELVPKPVSPYGVTKLAAEHLMTLYASAYGVPAVSLRYFTVYGPRQRPDMAFRRFITQALRGEKLVIFGDGEQSRDFTYIDDILEANLLAAAHGAPGEVFNIGGGSVTTVNEVVNILKRELGSLEVEYLEQQLGDARHTSADTARARSRLHFAPQVQVADGLRREIDWVQKYALA